jgi:O-antigen/teichoic acid export membrane protein
MLLRHWNLTAVYSLFAFGQDRRISLTTLADGVITVTASIILVMRWGLIGAAVGPILGVTLVALPANLSGLARELRTPVSHLIVCHWPWLWRFLLLAALAATSALVWVPRSLPALVAITLASLAAYGALMFPFALRDPLGVYVRPRIETLRRLVIREAATTEADA